MKNAYGGADSLAGAVEARSKYRAGKGGQMTHEPLLFGEVRVRNSCVRHLNSLLRDRLEKNKKPGHSRSQQEKYHRVN